MRSAQDIFGRAVAFHRQGQAARARELYRLVPEEAPERGEALFLCAVAAHQEGLLAEAAATYRLALEKDPDRAETALNLGLCLHVMNDQASAAAAFAKASRLSPNDAAPWHGLGQALLSLSRLPEALSAMRRAVALSPNDPETQNGLGGVLRAMGDLDGAEEAFGRAMAADPQNPDAPNNLGVILKSKKRLEEAAGLFRRAASLDPGFTEARDNLGNALREMGYAAEAKAAYKDALAVGEATGDAVGAAVKLALFTPMFCDSNARIDTVREDMAAGIEGLARQGLRLADPYAQVGYTNFFLAYHGREDRPLQEATARMYLAASPELSFIAPHCEQPRRKAERLRVGFISAFLREHTIGKLNRGVIEHLDSERFEKVVLRPPGRDDALSSAIDAAADRVLRLPDDLAAARQAVAGAACDILYYTDVGMDPLTYFLAFSRLAPVQCATWGHPVTTGIPNMDWFVSCSDMEPEGAQGSYSEKLAALDGLTTYYYRPEIPSASPDRAALGLPEGKRLYVCPQSLFKMHPEFDAALLDILRRDAQGLVVLIHEPHPHPAEVLRERLRLTGAEEVDRVVFLPRLSPERFLGLLALADCLLDTFHFGGGNTTLEALAAGAAPVTLPGAFARGRITLAMYRSMGLTELVAGAPGEYVEIALRMARDRDFKAHVRDEVLARRGILFEDMGAVRRLERFFEAAYAQGAEGAKE